MAPRMWIWPRYAIEVDGKRVVIPKTAGAAISRLFCYAQRYPGHFISTEEMIEAAYFDDPEGGPVWADGCVKVAFHKARQILRRIGVDVQGDRGRGHSGYRLILP